MIAAPLFHSWGFAHFVLGPGPELHLRPAAQVRPRGDAEGDRRRAARPRSSWCPVMMQRILELPEETLDKYDLPQLRVTAASGSALPGELGDEVDGHASATTSTTSTAPPRSPGRRSPRPRTCARPRARPAGRRAAPWSGSSTRTETTSSRARPAASSSATRWPSRATRAAAARTSSSGLLSSGDVGHFDEEGRLFIDGRDDEMIVSGGENVFPREVEDLLSDHDGIKEVAVIGVDDEEFGQRLKAFVVPDDGRRARARTRSRATSSRTSPATRSPARSSSSTRCRATRPARS